MTEAAHEHVGRPARLVTFNTGDGEAPALVVGDHGGGTLDLIVFGAGTPERHNSVPRRDPADYGPEGGGDTWH